jgi:hypothetical protein
MKINPLYLFFLLVVSLGSAQAQGTVPTFSHAVGQNSYTLLGRDPGDAQTTTVPVVLVPITLSFDAKKIAGKPFVMDAVVDVPHILRSPIFSRFAFASGNDTQYADAMLRTTFPLAKGWHTLFGKPEVKPLKITVPLGYGSSSPRKRPEVPLQLSTWNLCRRKSSSNFRSRMASLSLP